MVIKYQQGVLSSQVQKSPESGTRSPPSHSVLAQWLSAIRAVCLSIADDLDTVVDNEFPPRGYPEGVAREGKFHIESISIE